jgi:hypothetical protein
VSPLPSPEWLFVGESFVPRIRPSWVAEARGKSLGWGRVISVERRGRDEQGNDWLGWGGPGDGHWVPEALAANVDPRNQREGNLPIGEEIVDRRRAVPPDYEPDDLAAAPKWASHYEWRVCRLRAEALEKALEMLSSAADEGLKLRIVSAYRSAETQRSVYLRKIEKAGLGQKTVAKPGHSEHQLGTAIDVAGPVEANLLEASFGRTPEGRWMRANAARFGFILSYTEENQSETGYAPEPWHFRYVGPERAPSWRPAGREPGGSRDP